MTGLAEILQENTRLRTSLATTQGELATAKTELELRAAMLEELKRHAEYLARQLELIRLKHQRPVSERYVPDGQDTLPFKSNIDPPPRAPVADPQEDDEATEQPEGKKRPGKKRPKRRKREDVSHLSSTDVHCPATTNATCPSCGGQLKKIGVSTSFRVDWVPGHFIVHDVTRDKCACPSCPGQGVLTADGPYALNRSLAANGLLARVLTDKFADHIPANRQAKRMKREGFDIGSHTLSSWICAAGGLLQVVANAVRDQIFQGAMLQGDDTGMPVQDGGNGKLRKGRMWAFTDQQQVYYAFTESKAGKFPAELLATYPGELLLVDGGSEFNEVVSKLGLKRAGCWSHLRTYFFKALTHHPHQAKLALGTIRDLFLIERDIKGRDSAALLAERQARSRPLVDGFFKWVKAMSQITRPKSILGDALRYARNQEELLRLFLEHGQLPIHNNLSELMLRQTVVGRKNWLFARSEGGAKAAAAIYTLIGSCGLQGVDPWLYLHDVLNRLLDWPSNRVGELTPERWASRTSCHTA